MTRTSVGVDAEKQRNQKTHTHTHIVVHTKQTIHINSQTLLTWDRLLESGKKLLHILWRFKRHECHILWC